MICLRYKKINQLLFIYYCYCIGRYFFPSYRYCQFMCLFFYFPVFHRRILKCTAAYHHGHTPGAFIIAKKCQSIGFVGNGLPIARKNQCFLCEICNGNQKNNTNNRTINALELRKHSQYMLGDQCYGPIWITRLSEISANDIKKKQH